MINNIFNLEATARHHLYFCMLCFFLGYGTVAYAYFFVIFLFYWDEFKVEFLDFDEYLEDCMEAFEFDATLHLGAAREWETVVTEHYSQPGRSFPQELYVQHNASDPSSDYEQGRLLDAYDHPEMYGVWEVSEYLHEEWQAVAEYDIEPTAQHTFDDLEIFYAHYNGDRKVDTAQNNNKHRLHNLEYAWFPVTGKALSSQKWCFHRQKNADLTHFLWSAPDDFRLIRSEKQQKKIAK